MDCRFLVRLDACHRAAFSRRRQEGSAGGIGRFESGLDQKGRRRIEKLLHDDLTYAHSAGLQQTKAQVIQTAMGPTTTEAIDFSDTTVRVYGNTALVKAHVELRNSNGGKATTNHLNILFVWVKGPGGWQLVARQASQQPLPAAQ